MARKVTDCITTNETIYSSIRYLWVVGSSRKVAAIESREEDAAEKPLFLVDAGHWASEWLWLEHASERLRDAVAAEGADLEVAVSRRRTDPWDFLVSTSEGEQQ